MLLTQNQVKILSIKAISNNQIVFMQMLEGLLMQKGNQLTWHKRLGMLDLYLQRSKSLINHKT